MTLTWEDTNTGGGCTALMAYRKAMYVITCPDDPSIPEPGEAAFLGIYPHRDSWCDGESFIYQGEFANTDAAKVFAENYVVPRPPPDTVGAALWDCTLDWARHLDLDILALEVGPGQVVAAAVINWCMSLDRMVESFREAGQPMESHCIDRMMDAVSRNCDIALRG